MVNFSVEREAEEGTHEGVQALGDEPVGRSDAKVITQSRRLDELGCPAESLADVGLDLIGLGSRERRVGCFVIDAATRGDE